MQPECPKCGCKLSSFDTEETQHCPSCGLRLSAEKPAPFPEARFRADAERVWVGILWIVLLIGPGIVTVLIGVRPNSIPLAYCCAVLIALACSILIGLRKRKWAPRICTMLRAFIVSLFVSAFVVFGWFLVLLKYASLH